MMIVTSLLLMWIVEHCGMCGCLAFAWNCLEMFSIQPIVADIFRDDAITTVQVLVLQVDNKTELADIINFLSNKLPLNRLSLNHLKRINSKRKNCQVLICPIPQHLNDETDIIQRTIHEMDQDLQDFIYRYDREKLKICPVPTSAPLTRNQFKQISTYWPVNFHENKYIAGCLNGTIFSKDHLEKIYELMSDTLNLSDYTNQSCQNVSAIITKNNGKQIVAKAVSKINQHPLHHAVIIAVTMVSDIHSKTKSEKNDLPPDLIRNFKEDYLCTNYECFISQEPCIMCAMALVHSRIKRVFFYSDPNRKKCDDCNDQPYIIHNLHINPHLNHRYEVWKLSPSTEHEKFNPNKKLKS